MSDLRDIRDRDFKRECRRQTALALGRGETPTVADIIKRAVSSPAPGYYLDYDYALTTLYRVRNGMTHSRTEKRLMWEELARKVDQLMSQGSHQSIADALNQVLADEGASRYFITPGYGKKLYEQLRRNRPRSGRNKQN